MIEYKEIDAKKVKAYKRYYIKHYKDALELAGVLLELMKPFDGKKITKRVETALRKALIGKYNIKTVTPWNDEKAKYAAIFLTREYSWWDLKIHFDYKDYDGKEETYTFTISYLDDYIEDHENNKLKTNYIPEWIAEAEQVLIDIDAASKKWNKAVKVMDELMAHKAPLDRVPSRFYKMRGY